MTLDFTEAEGSGRSLGQEAARVLCRVTPGTAPAVTVALRAAGRDRGAPAGTLALPRR
jgi:hypothetical protein